MLEGWRDCGWRSGAELFASHSGACKIMVHTRVKLRITRADKKLAPEYLVRMPQKFSWFVFATVLIFSFQNCSKGFKAAQNSSASSAQCMGKIRAETNSLNLNSSELNCADFNSYACERRIFSP